MDNEREVIEKSLVKEKMIIICSAIVAVLLLITELYIVMNSPSIIMLAVIAIVFVIVLFILLNSVIVHNQKTKKLDRLEYEELYKTQKASYLVIRKNFEELQDRIADLEESGAVPASDIIQAQKAMAKVQISRSKENADALMNANEELLTQIMA
ncbi:MAG: hypothetical protein IIU40_09960, partial [Lachnospiraceae bacterium]|nr:hypothetical protein [Lachnospiraceae bacterium]